MTFIRHVFCSRHVGRMLYNCKHDTWPEAAARNALQHNVQPGTHMTKHHWQLCKCNFAIQTAKCLDMLYKYNVCSLQFPSSLIETQHVRCLLLSVFHIVAHACDHLAHQTVLMAVIAPCSSTHTAESTSMCSNSNLHNSLKG